MKDEVLLFRQDFTLDDPSLESFEIVISDLKAIALKENITQESMESEKYAKNHKIDMAIRWFETNEQSVQQRYSSHMDTDEIISIGYKEVLDIKNHIDEAIVDGMISK